MMRMWLTALPPAFTFQLPSVSALELCEGIPQGSSMTITGHNKQEAAQPLSTHRNNHRWLERGWRASATLEQLLQQRTQPLPT